MVKSGESVISLSFAWRDVDALTLLSADSCVCQFGAIKVLCALEALSFLPIRVSLPPPLPTLRLFCLLALLAILLLWVSLPFVFAFVPIHLLKLHIPFVNMHFLVDAEEVSIMFFWCGCTVHTLV